MLAWTRFARDILLLPAPPSLLAPLAGLLLLELPLLPVETLLRRLLHAQPAHPAQRRRCDETRMAGLPAVYCGKLPVCVCVADQMRRSGRKGRTEQVAKEGGPSLPTGWLLRDGVPYRSHHPISIKPRRLQVWQTSAWASFVQVPCLFRVDADADARLVIRPAGSSASCRPFSSS